MAFTPPTAADFKTRFPEFSSVPDATVNAILTDEAIPLVDDSWLERDRKPAMLYYVAHQLTQMGYPLASGVTTPPAGGGAGVLKRRKVGDVEVEYMNEWERLGVGNGNLDREGWSLTLYGRQFLNYMRRNFAPVVRVV